MPSTCRRRRVVVVVALATTAVGALTPLVSRPLPARRRTRDDCLYPWSAARGENNNDEENDFVSEDARTDDARNLANQTTATTQEDIARRNRRAFLGRAEVRDGKPVAAAPRFLGADDGGRGRARRRERDLLSRVAGPQSFAAFAALLAATFFVYAFVFFSGGITNGADRYAPGADGASETATELYGAVLPNEVPQNNEPRLVTSSDVATQNSESAYNDAAEQTQGLSSVREKAEALSRGETAAADDDDVRDVETTAPVPGPVV